jgi:hypothetical protein
MIWQQRSLEWNLLLPRVGIRSRTIPGQRILWRCWCSGNMEDSHSVQFLNLDTILQIQSHRSFSERKHSILQKWNVGDPKQFAEKVQYLVRMRYRS